MSAYCTPHCLWNTRVISFINSTDMHYIRCQDQLTINMNTFTCCKRKGLVILIFPSTLTASWGTKGKYSNPQKDLFDGHEPVWTMVTSLCKWPFSSRFGSSLIPKLENWMWPWVKSCLAWWRWQRTSRLLCWHFCVTAGHRDRHCSQP